MKPQPATIQGQYGQNGYEIWCGGRIVYSAGNHVHDSTQHVTTKQDRLPLKTIRQFCIKTAHEIAEEQDGTLGGVEPVEEER